MNANTIFGQSPAEEGGTVRFSELEEAFKTPTQRQDYYEIPKTVAGESIPESLLNPEGVTDFEEDDETPVSPEHYRRAGERIARLVDTGIDFALSNLVARNNESYRADEKDLQDIAECWGEISQERGWNMGPGASLVILYIMVYGPLVKQAMTDRRVAELEARQDDMEAKLDEILKKSNPETKPHDDSTSEQQGGGQEPSGGGKQSPYTYQPHE